MAKKRLEIKILVFGKEDCSDFILARRTVKRLIKKYPNKPIRGIYYDVESFGGTYEWVSFYSIKDEKFPAIIIDRADKTVARWDGVVPTLEDLALALSKK